MMYVDVPPIMLIVHSHLQYIDIISLEIKTHIELFIHIYHFSKLATIPNKIKTKTKVLLQYRIKLRKFV